MVVEAKGHTNRRVADVECGIVQAYDRLHETNVANDAAPADTVSKSVRTLARELNVGILLFHDAGNSPAATAAFVTAVRDRGIELGDR
nr:hypothetical protein [Halobaculum saliterrae]